MKNHKFPYELSSKFSRLQIICVYMYMVIKRYKVFFENLLIKKLTYDLPPNLQTVAEIFCL